jgi:putative ABC transport system permease protein
VLIGFAGILAVALVYNTARIALRERARELASLRVLGFTKGEISLMLLGEQALLAGVGLAGGLAAGFGLAALLSGLYQWELFRLPLEISTRTYVQSAGVVLAAAAVSGLLVRRRLIRLDLVAVLKTRE